MWDWVSGPDPRARGQKYSVNQIADNIRRNNTILEDLDMCQGPSSNPTKKEDPNVIKANQVWYIDGAPYVVLQPLAKYLRSTDGEQTPYVVIREQGGENVELLTRKKFQEVATRTAPDVKRYISFEQIMVNKPCWVGAVRAAFIMGVIPYDGPSLEQPSWYWLGRQAAMSQGKSQVAWDVQRLYEEFTNRYGRPDLAYMKFVAEALKLIPEGVHPDYATLKRLLGVK